MAQIDLTKRNGKPLTLGEYILTLLAAEGPKTDVEIAKVAERPVASVRRTRKILQNQNKVKATNAEAPRSGQRGLVWGLVTADAV